MTPTDTNARAPLSLASLFREHAVLQCDRPLPVWGWAPAGETVVVRFKQQQGTAVADAEGAWRVRLAPEPASATPAQLTVTAGARSVVVDDILVGEVWLASGQSNITRPLSDTFQAETEIAAADFPLIRHFTVGRSPAESPAAVVDGSWQVCAPAVAAKFSGVGYFFARDLHRRLGVPVGLIHGSWGGTPIEAWLGEETLRAVSVYPAIAARKRKDWAEFKERERLHPVEQAAWKVAEDRALAERVPNPLPWPTVPIGPGTPYAPGRLYNGMIAPLQPSALRGVVWWQGEANVTRAGEYAELFQALIRSWRAAWGHDFPFYFAQLSNYGVGWDASRRRWAQLRGAQAEALALPATGMVVTMDAGDPYEMHLLHKDIAGGRLAQLALARTYGHAGPWTGPVFASATPEGAAMRVRFTVDAAGLVLRDGGATAFEVAGVNRVFHPAVARVDGDTLCVSVPAVTAPVAVRYGWTNAPDASLFSRDGLPAAQFRSDDWPVS